MQRPLRSAHPRTARTLATAAALALTSATLAVAAPRDGSAPATATPVPDEARYDEAALRAIVEHWTAAERDGDVAYLGQLLAPAYRSVNPTGGATTRAALLERAERSRRSAEARAERRAAGEAFLRAHPTEVAVAIDGPVGIVSYYDPRRGLDHSVRGSDVFVYEHNRWHAIYSMHNSVE